MPAIARDEQPEQCRCRPPDTPLPQPVIDDEGWDCPACGREWSIDWEPTLMPAEAAKAL